MIKRNILLIEPNYLNKYPPLGLMKISAYHKLLGDKVYFFKGDYLDYFRQERLSESLRKFNLLKSKVKLTENIIDLITNYLMYKRTEVLDQIRNFYPLCHHNTINKILNHYAFHYQLKKKWDRVYITTLFTFYWTQTKKAIEFGLKVVKENDGLYVGGVAASLIPQIIAEETGLIVGKNILTGLLDKPGVLDKNKIIIDTLTPDYSILETIDHKYPLDTGFLTYMTRGCTRTCSFCAVPKLEPIYKDKISIHEQINAIRKLHGDRKDLILMDNNVLGSPLFPQIIEEIIELGFNKSSKYLPENKFESLCNYLKKERNTLIIERYLKNLFEFLNVTLSNKVWRIHDKSRYFELLRKNNLDNFKTFTKETLLLYKNEIGYFAEKYRDKIPKNRYVDFNQGIDCRYIDEEKMKLLSLIPIRPMRIAFDYLSLKKQYVEAIRLADKYQIKDLSNYILYNYVDNPEDLWQRLKINVDLHKELNSNIFSFPMKFVPLYGYESLNRNYVGKNWNKKYLRAIQCILNVTKGIGMPGTEFFERAFGKTIDEYFNILLMPEPLIMYRNFYEERGITKRWLYELKNLTQKQLDEAKGIILSNDFFSFNGTTSKSVVSLMKIYQIKHVPSLD